MERISSDIHALLNEAKFEVENFELGDDEKLIAYFSEFPSIAGFPFRIVFIQKADGTVHSRFRQWDTAYDYKRWDNGVYNLDRLRIITEQKVLSTSEKEILKQCLLKLEGIQLPLSIKDEKALVLDGSDWKFGINHGSIKVDFAWKAATNDLDLFVSIIALMENQHAGTNKRRSN